jgi:hypothetical protein
VISEPIEKMMPPIMALISIKSSSKIPIIIFQMLLAGRRTHNIIIEHLFHACNLHAATIEASNFEPHGNLGPLITSSVANLGELGTKN